MRPDAVHSPSPVPPAWGGRCRDPTLHLHRRAFGHAQRSPWPGSSDWGRADLATGLPMALLFRRKTP